MQLPMRGRVALPSHPIALAVVAFVSYAVAVELYYLAFGLADALTPVATFFPPAGLALTLFLGSPYSRWPVVVGAIWGAEVTVDVLHGVAFWDCALWGVANTVEPMVAAVLLWGFIRPEGRNNIASTRHLMAFLGSAVLAGPAVGALIALPSAPAGDLETLTGFWSRWWIGDGIGVLVVTPLLLILGNSRPRERSWGAPWLALVTVLSAITLGPAQPVAHGRGAYLLLPTLVWIAFRASPLTSAAAVFIVGLSANLATLAGVGPFVEPGRPYVGQANAQIFIGTVAFSALLVVVLSANLIQRDKVELVVRHQARTDVLTGIGNRRMLFDRLDGFRSTHALQAGDPIAFLLLDLDDFKRVNDRFGHAAGDLVLKTIADRLVMATRSDETVVRFGGDEFLLCLTKSCSPDQVRALSGRLSAVVAEPIAIGTESVQVVASIGVAEGLWGDFNPDEFLRRADEEMYSAKRRPLPGTSFRSPGGS
ncbi:GGDEF domain-containing protein [Nocardioides bigeumensis]|uniref:GGDEF domain-containing protein n=1 Tax=Nocardioides bigeumensis TaxID=433657 RepID=A0ABP5J9E6_9ACTN